MGFDFVQLAHELDRLGLDVQRFGLNPSLLQLPVAQQAASTASTPSESTAVSRSPHRSHLAVAVKHAMDIRDAVADIFYQLVASKPWWILEIIPMLTTYQEQSGKWTRMRVRVVSHPSRSDLTHIICRADATSV